MARKYKNAKTSYKKLDDDKKIDFLLSKIDDVTSHADKLISNINKRASNKKPTTTKEKLQKGYISIGFSHKRLWDERVALDKLFAGSDSVLNKDLLELYKQKIIIKQTNNAPEVFRDNSGTIYADFPKEMPNSFPIMQRAVLELFMGEYWEFLHTKLKVLWGEKTKRKLSIEFIKKSKLILITEYTEDSEIKTILRKVLGFRFEYDYLSQSSFTWDQIIIRILQIGAMAKYKKDPTTIESGCLCILNKVEEGLLKNLDNKI